MSIFLIQQSLHTGNQAYKFGILLKPIINKAYLILVQKNVVKVCGNKKTLLSNFLCLNDNVKMPSHQMLLGEWCQWIHSTFNKVVVIIFCPLNYLHTQLSFERNRIFGRAYCNNKMIYLNALSKI